MSLWPRVRVRNVRVYPTECGQQLGRDPSKKWELRIPCFELQRRAFSREGTLWDLSLLVFLTLYACALWAPTSLLPRNIPLRNGPLRVNFTARMPFCAADALWGGVTHAFGQVLSTPNCAMPLRCATRLESHTPKSPALRKMFLASDAKTP